MRKLALFAVLLAGCVKTESGDLLTSGMHASIHVETLGTGTTDVRATLYLGNPLNLNFVELTGDDRLIARHAGMSKVMTESEVFNVISHHAQFQVDAEGAEFEVAFERTVDAGAPRSTATLPAKFTLVGPAAATVSRADPITLTWSPAGTTDVMSWEIQGDCIERESQNLVADTGTLTIETGRVRKRMGDTIADSCEMTIRVGRSRLGTLDPGYGKGGTILAHQVRTVVLTSVP
jgi:hypothetical protein